MESEIITRNYDELQEEQSTPQTHGDVWPPISERLRKLVGEDAFQRWFRSSEWLGAQDGSATIAVAGEMHQVWVETNYLPELTLAVSEFVESIHEVRVVVSERVSGEAETPAAAPVHHQPATEIVDEAAAERRAKTTGLNPAYTFSRFVVGANSQFAHAACLAVAKSGVGYNPLFIHGGPGLGKTHLMHAIGQEILRHRPGTRVIYLTCEKFTNEFIDSVGKGNLGKFRSRYRSTDVLLIDDIQFLAGKDKTQEEFFHTFNTLLDGRNQVVLTCDRPASEIKSLEPRLVSRFECGLAVELQAPGMETRLAILQKKARDWKVKVEQNILTFLAERIRSNVRRLEGALMRVATYTSLAGESVHLEKVEHLLRDLLHEENSRQISIDAIQKAVAEHYDVRLADMTSRRRPASIAFPRQVAMYLSRNLTKVSLIEIGDAFGGRDHGTVIHACKKINERLASEPSLKDAISRLESRLGR